MIKTVLIINSSPPYEEMFKKEGWNVITRVSESLNYKDRFFIQFTSGEDVSPAYYGEEPHPKTYSNKSRDDYESYIFNMAIAKKIPMAGICRGGQFLHVMNTGQLYQHVDGHAIYDTHLVTDYWTRKVYEVSSTHHQMMRSNSNVDTILIAYAKGVSSFKEHYPLTKPDKGVKKELSNKDTLDIECCFYPRTKSLCFQPHPEFDNVKECREMYFEYINEYLFNGDLK